MSLKAAEELELALLGQKGFLANYFLDGNAGWLDKLEERKSNFKDWLDKADQTALTAPEKDIIRDIRVLYGLYENERSRSKSAYESGRIDEAKSILSKDMWQAFEALYKKCEDYIRINETIIANSEASLRKKIIGMIIFMIVSNIVVISFVGFMFYLLIRRILSSVENVAVIARNISLKSLSGRVRVEGLEDEMAYLARSVNMMLERLERSFEYVKEFSSSIGHELKSPLAIIKGETEVALRKERPPEDYRKALNVNLEEANRMIRIVEDLVFLAKLDYSPQNIDKENFDFIPFFNDTAKRVQKLVEQKQIIFESAVLYGGDAAIKGNKLHLSRLFFNLVQNAVKFTPEGGRIVMSAGRKGNFLEVSISDTGVGISEEDLPRIFQRFFHKDKFRSESSDSIGLGLSIARSIARFHNGDIEVKSAQGEGTVFTVILPVTIP